VPVLLQLHLIVPVLLQLHLIVPVLLQLRLEALLIGERD